MSLAGLGLFSLTLLEVLAYAIPLATIAISGWLHLIQVPFEQLIPFFSLLLIMLGLAALSAILQLQDMISLITRPSYDPVTSALSRRSGIDSLVREFQRSVLHDDHFAIAMIELNDLDEYTRDYDTNTHDQVILEVADILAEDLRNNDSLIRWREHVFLIMFPNTNCAGLRLIIERIRKIGMGTLPDGQPITASIGASERTLDLIPDWHACVKLVEQRLQYAKGQGKDYTVYCGEHMTSYKSVQEMAESEAFYR
jgi:diguanylate cyclase (GGDEF)-like protein